MVSHKLAGGKSERAGENWADPNGKIKKLKKVTEKLQKEADIAKEEVVQLTAVVDQAQTTAT